MLRKWLPIIVLLFISNTFGNTIEQQVVAGGSPRVLLGAQSSPGPSPGIPKGAAPLLGTVLAQRELVWPTHPYPALIGGLIEHESCITATHSKCWNPNSKLKTAREEGAGLGQITRAYKSDGTLRFDALSEMKNKHPALSGMTWDNVYSRPDLQIKALLFKLQDDYSVFKYTLEPLSFTDAAYNGGVGGVQKDMRACMLKKGCDPKVWFNNVETTCTKSRSPIYAGRSACDINRHHVIDVFIKSEKYKGKI